MNTKTKPAAEPNPATQQDAAEPKPAYAFSSFIRSSPLEEAAKKAGIPTEGIFSASEFIDTARRYLRHSSPPPMSEEGMMLHLTTSPLLKRLKEEVLTKEEQYAIQREILDIKAKANAPQIEHQNRVTEFNQALQKLEADFDEWITTDPAGIAAAAQDKAHNDWMDAEEARIFAEAKEAERQARIEKARAKRKQEAIELENEIGSALFDTDTDHPDIDGKTFQAFMKWVPENEDRVNYDGPQPINAILVGLPGVGKSRALAAAAVADCEKRGRENIEWVTGYEFAELVSSLSTDKRTEANARLEVITDAWHLYFDDLGSANFTAARTARFFRLIDERYRRNRITFFSTNHTPQQLRKIFTSSSESKDEAVRILRRIIGTPSHPLAQLFQFKKPATN
jgi:DNA replication protein DnaC